MKKRILICLSALYLFSLSATTFVSGQEANASFENKNEIISRALSNWEQGQVNEIAVEEVNQSKKTAVIPSVSESISAPSPEKIMIDVLEFKDMDIMDVLRFISQKSGLNIVAGKNVRGKITIYLKNVDVWDVLRIILETNDLAYEKEDNIIKVVTAPDYEQIYGRRFDDRSQIKILPLRYTVAADLVPLLTQIKSSIGKVLSDDKSNNLVLIDTPVKLAEMQDLIKEVDVPVSTRVFGLDYANVEALEKQLSEVVTKNVGRIKVDSRSHQVWVTDTPVKLQEIASIISAFDERHRQVLIEARIVKVVLNDEFKMGVDWDTILRGYHNLGVTGSFNILTTADKKGKFSIGTIDTDDYTLVVEALNTVGKTNILSSPRISALNNEEAKILVGSTEPYVTTTTTTTASGPTITAESVNFIDVGVKLFVTPIVNKDAYITMKIRPEVSSVTSYLTTGQNNKIPVVDTTTAETTVMVKDGVTIVIGGLIKEEVIDTVKKVPFMGDLPLVGFLFRNKDSLAKKTELVVFLTPHIVSGDYSSYGMSQPINK